MKNVTKKLGNSPLRSRCDGSKRLRVEKVTIDTLECVQFERHGAILPPPIIVGVVQQRS